MSDETIKKLFELMDEKRGNVRFDIPSIIQLAVNNNINIGAEELWAIACSLGSYNCEMLCPPIVVSFIKLLVSHYEIKSILDPWCGFGTLLTTLSSHLKTSTNIGIAPNSNTIEAAQALHGKKSIKWILGDPIKKINELDCKFDLIAGCLPFGVVNKGYLPEGQEAISDTHEALILLNACLKLNDNGVGIFTVSRRFIAPARKTSVYSNLAMHGFKIDAYLALPPASFSPLTGIPTGLVVIRRGKQESIFVGEVDSNPENYSGLIDRYIQRKGNKNLPTGKLIEYCNFTGYESLREMDEIDSLAIRTGVPPTKLFDISLGINRSSTQYESRFLECTNAVYLPLVGRGIAVSSLSDLKTSANNYAQILINPDKANPFYVASFFNSSLGLKIRESLCYSAVGLPKISMSALREMEIYIPALDVQNQVTQAEIKIQNLMSELEELKASLWTAPRKIEKTIRSIAKVNHEERFSDWIENLPFPLASILHAYHVADGDFKKYQYLDYFFEALTEFVGIIFLSAFNEDEELLKSELDSILPDIRNKNLSLERASLGLWCTILQKLSKRARTMLNGEGKQGDEARCAKERCYRLFHTSNDSVLEALLNSKLGSVLQETITLRNEWRGHGGAAGDKIYKERNICLEKHLADIRQIFGDIWGSYQLVLPGTLECHDDNTFDVNVKKIIGANSLFPSGQLKSMNKALSKGRLYIVDDVYKTGLKLLPLIYIGSTPESEPAACYFYNRKQSDGLRFVSYHYEAQPENISKDMLHDRDITAIFNLFNLAKK